MHNYIKNAKLFFIIIIDLHFHIIMQKYFITATIIIIYINIIY